MLKLANVIMPADMEAALADVEAGCSVETADLLRAVFGGFRVLAQGVGAELVHGADEEGKAHLYLVIKFDGSPDLGSTSGLFEAKAEGAELKM
jgi:hypothetical protein